MFLTIFMAYLRNRASLMSMEEIADEEKGNMEASLESSLEEFNDNYGHEFETEEEAQDYIENYGVELGSRVYDTESFIHFIG